MRAGRRRSGKNKTPQNAAARALKRSLNSTTARAATLQGDMNQLSDRINRTTVSTCQLTCNVCSHANENIIKHNVTFFSYGQAYHLACFDSFALTGGTQFDKDASESGHT